MKTAVWWTYTEAKPRQQDNYDIMLIHTTTAVNIINVDNDDDGAEGEGVNNDDGGGNITGGGVNITSFFLSFLKF